MTTVTTITEYEIPSGKVVNGHNDQGARASLVYSNDEAKITTWDCDGEEDQQFVHPDDAMIEFLSFFFRMG